MLVRYFKRPSRIEQLRGSTGGHLLEGFAKELSQGCYQWVAAPYRAFADSTAISILVARAMRHIGINCSKRGAAHILRHSVASLCYGKECPCKISLACSATVPSRLRRFTPKWTCLRWGR